MCFPIEENNDVVATVHQSNVYLYNLRTRTSEHVLRDLGFSPTAMCSGNGYLAVGGQRSQVIVKSLEDEEYMAQTTVGGAINNALHITQHLNGEVRLMVCNNDETIKIFSLPSMDHIGDIKMESAVNSVCVSPDGSLMVATGDSGEVVLFGVSASEGYVPLTSQLSIMDAGFSCSWDSSSTRFAVAGQDGQVSVWDARMLRSKGEGRIARIEATQKIPKGAARCVKFSQGMSMDILAFAEHTSFLNVVDTRRFEERQRIRLSQPGTDLNISGIAGFLIWS